MLNRLIHTNILKHSRLNANAQILAIANRQASKMTDPVERSEKLVAVMENDIRVANPNDEFSDWLDPLNPPRLNFEHVKMIKNIDYSPIIARAREGGMFTVGDVMKIMEESGADRALKSFQDDEHKQDPFVFEETFDIFNKGKKDCPLCIPDPTEERVNRIHYTNVNLLRRFVSITGMISPKKLSGVCSVHQNKLRYAIKNARSLALLSATTNWQVPTSFVYPDQYAADEDQPQAHYLEATKRVELVHQRKLAGVSAEIVEDDDEARELLEFFDDFQARQ